MQERRGVRMAARAVALAASLAAGSTLAEADIAKLAWLAGCWQNDAAESGSGEHWMPLAGGTMLGTSRTVRQGVTVEFEFMELRQLPDGTLAYIAHPSGQRTTTFPLLRISDSEAVFENAGHDFPQRVAYTRLSHSRLRARIEGMRDGELRVIEFPLVRTTCESQ
jgi:hypothetical protein